RLDDWLATKASALFSTMGCFWAFFILSLLPLVNASLMEPVQFISSGVLQLIALPLIAVAAKIEATRNASAAREQHDAVMETLADVRVMMADVHSLTSATKNTT
ncbi:MAG: hypothetical protein KGL35_11760, partial [Bradyrhizobium sp.]|nr:hypothetical protein [Bradyrhizobium sp.]